MFSHLRHNRLASTLGQVIRLDLAFTRDQGLSCATSHPIISSWFRINIVHMSYHRERVHVSFIISGYFEHPSIRVQSRHWPSCAHVMLFTNTLPNSGCKIQLLTLGLRCNTGTPMASDTILERPISNEVARDTRLTTLAFTVTHTYATGYLA